jgi:hypothetical protein
MPKISPEVAEALKEITQSTAKTAQDKVVVAIAALAWPAEEAAPAPAPEPPAA